MKALKTVAVALGITLAAMGTFIPVPVGSYGLTLRSAPEGAAFSPGQSVQIMTDKGLVVRDESQRAHVYEPRLSEQRTQRQLLGDLMDRAFGGSPAKLVLQALSTKRASRQELAEIRRLIEQMEKGKA